MKKVLFIFAAIISSFLMADAQKVMNRDKQVVGYITDEGVVLDSAYNTMGYFKDDGSITNANYTTIGYVKQDGSVRGSSGKKIGSISPEGMIYNAKKNLVGSIGSNGHLLDSQGRTVAILKNVESDLGAISIFFFFKLAGLDYYNDNSTKPLPTVSAAK